MASKSDKRNTQINFFDIGAGEVSSQRNKPPRDGLNHKNDATSKLNGKRARSPYEDTVDTRDGLRPFKLPTIAESGVRAYELGIKHGLPWKSYEKVYSRELSGPVTVAARETASSELVIVREFAVSNAEKTLHMFQRIQHDKIIAAIEVFMAQEALYVVLEYLPVSLEQMVKSPAYPNELQLAAIVGQILDGVAYLASEGFEHGSLDCSNILLSTEGDVKITHQECCNAVPRNATRDVRALGFIMMELMQKYAKDDGAVGVDDLRRWPSNSDAVGFLSETTSAASPGALIKHPLLKRPLQKEKLKGIISLAQVSVRPRYKYVQ